MRHVLILICYQQLIDTIVWILRFCISCPPEELGMGHVVLALDREPRLDEETNIRYEYTPRSCELNLESSAHAKKS